MKKKLKIIGLCFIELMYKFVVCILILVGIFYFLIFHQSYYFANIDNPDDGFSERFFLPKKNIKLTFKIQNGKLYLPQAIMRYLNTGGIFKPEPIIWTNDDVIYLMSKFPESRIFFKFNQKKELMNVFFSDTMNTSSVL